MSLLPKSIHRCRRYPTKFNSGRDIPPGSDRVQNLHRGEHEFAGPQLPWLSARQYAVFFFADHRWATAIFPSFAKLSSGN